MPTLRELITKLSFQTDTKPLDKVGKAIEGIRSRLNVLVGIEALKGLASLTDSFGNFALDLRNSAAAAGLTAEEFQKLTYAAGQAGVSQEAMGSTLKSLNKHLQDARLGSEQAALAFAYAGVPAEQIGSFRNAEDALYAVGKSLNAIQDPVRRATSAQELLGDQGPRLLASLAATSGGLRELSHSAEASAAAVGTKNLDALARTEQALTGLRAQAMALARNVAAQLAPALTTGIKAITKWVFTNQGLVRADFKEWAKKVAYYLGAVAGVIAGVAHDVSLLVRRFMDWGKTSGVFKRLGEDFKTIGKILTPLFAALYATALSLSGVLTDVFESALNSLDRLMRAVGDAVMKVSDLLTHPFDFSKWEEALESIAKLIYEIAKAPTDVIVTAITSLYDAGNKLFQLLFGKSFSETWLGQAISAVAGAPSKFADMRAFKKGPISSGASGNAPDSAALGYLMDRTSGPMQQGNAPAPASVAPATVTRLAQAPTVNTPITVNIQGDANSAPVLKAVKEGVHEGVNSVLRYAQADAASGMLY